MTGFSRRGFAGLMIGGSLGLATHAFAADGINETGFVQIGGIEQWIAIQGRDRANPVILFLHGGPGEAQSPFLSDFTAWQRDFTVVNWDQRGAGKTYEKNGTATPDVTVNRIIDDTIALSEHVLAKLGKKKLILVGQSAGTMLGLKVAQRRPDLFYAFVGTGQFVSVVRMAEWQETQTNVAPTHDVAEIKALHQWAIQAPPDRPYIQRQMAFMGSPDHPEPRAAAWVAGYHFEGSRTGKDVQAFDAMTDVPDLAVPYILIQGRDDRITPFAVAKTYFDAVRSKGKVFVTIEGGHFACFTNTDGFLDALRTHVLPLTR